MKKLICVFLLVFAQIFYSQESDKEGSAKASFLQAQPITVTIGGSFLITGSFIANRFQRLDQFITTYFTQAQLNALRGLTQIEAMKEVTKEINSYALRDITLKRSTGEEIKIDLLRFRLTGDFKYNPYLMNDDVIIFPAYDDVKSVVSIEGAINKPTKFQFVQGDKLSDAILFAGGLNNSYQNINQAEISRLDNSGTKEQLLTVNIKDDVVLQSGDRVRILADENQKSDYKVLVLGQVKIPGYVFIPKDGIALSEIIKKSGGLTENADLRAAEVIRDRSSLEMLRKNKLTEEYNYDPTRLITFGVEYKQRFLRDSIAMSRLSTMVDEDKYYFNIDNNLRLLKSESLVDFTKLTDPNSDESKFIVKEGDLVLIPDKFDYVYVFGQVARAGYIKYEPNKDYKYYVEKSGGLAETAQDLDETIIIKGKELNWITKDKEKISIVPGDFVYVPKDAPRSFWYTMSRIATVTSIIGAVVTTIYAFTKF